MAATATVLGSYSTKITVITLTARAVETVAHSLGTTPTFVFPMTKGSAANTSLAGTIAIESYDATNVVFRNTGGQNISGEALVVIIHTENL